MVVSMPQQAIFVDIVRASECMAALAAKYGASRGPQPPPELDELTQTM